MKHVFLAALAAVFMTVSADAQLAMTRSTYTGSYSPISLPAATLSTATGDDVAQSAIPIGFTFNYLGNNFTAIGVNTNGVASFDAVMSASQTNNNLYSTNGPNNSLAPWWDNLWSDTILYQLQGTSPNQTFTIQWTNSFSYTTTSTQLINFEIILHETSNIIEFSYGTMTPGTTGPNESASIGIENATGGPGNYLDAVTGSAFTSNGMLMSATEWPSHNFRFTPGAPAVLAGGTYTVGNAGTYFNLSEALADINHRGISGPVSLSLLDANYDVTPANGSNFFPMLLGPVAGSSSVNTITIAPASGNATISSEGTVSANGNCGNAASNTTINSGNEPIFGLVGASYVTLQNLSLTCSSTGVVDRGLYVINSSATLGSQNNMFQNMTVMMNRASIGSYGINQQAITTPTNATGSNSNNTYMDLNISNVFGGIYLNGNVAFPDAGCVVGTSSPTAFNMIGGSNPGDLGGGTGGTNCYGIRANNQSGVTIYNNEVRNLANGGTGNTEGIVIDAGVGASSVYMNIVHDLQFTPTTGTTNITGIRVNLANTAGASANVYNNFVYGLASNYSGTATATRAIRGIWLQSTGGGSNASTINIDFNTVRIDGSSSPNLSNTCFESGAANGPVMNVRNNVFANFTGAQTGNANHYTMAAPNTTAIGNTGSVSDYNDLYVNTATNGNIGIGATTVYATLLNWQTAMTQDAASVNVDPGFFSATNLHVSSVAINNVGNATGSPWVTVDIDNQSRGASPDLGADEFAPLLLDAGVTALVTPVAAGCHTANELVSVTLKNYAAVPLDFTTDSVLVTVNVTGAITTSLTYMVNNNSLNGNLPLAVGASITVPVGNISMTNSGSYVFDSYSTLTGDGNLINDTMATVIIAYNAGTAVTSSSSVCSGSSIMLSLNGSTPGGTIQWQSSTDGGMTWTNETGTGFDSTTYVVIPTAASTVYQVVYCGGTLTNTVTVTMVAFSNPVVADDTVCGPGVVNLTANGTGTIYWYANATGGTPLTSGSAFSPNVAADSTFYVTNAVGSNTQGVGLLDNSAGGAMSGSNNNLIFDVYQYCTLQGVYVYPAAAGNVTVDLEDNTNAVINSATVAVAASDIGQRTWIPLNFSLSPGTGMQLVRNAASVQCWRNNVGVTYPYTLPGVLSITTSTAGAGFYYFFYDWQIDFACESPRVPLNVVVLTPPAIALSTGSTSICLGDSTSITVSSSNAGYAYTWGPAATLNTTSGATVTATPASTTTYTVNADDSNTGCRAVDSITVTVNSVAPITLTASNSLICPGANDTIVANAAQSVGLFDNSAGGNMSASANNLIFDVLGNCVLMGVYIYPASTGNVIIELQDNTNAIVNTATYVVTPADVNQRTYVPLNFNLTPATGMQLVRNAASVQCWRNNVGVTYPYTLPGALSITTSTAGNGFYYFFYDWQIAIPGSGPYTYVWSSSPAGYTGTNDSAFVAPAVTTQYFVTVTDTIIGCAAQYSTTINTAGALDVSVAGPPSLCSGDSTWLIASVTGGDGNISYNWSSGLGTNDSVMVTPPATTTYSVTAMDGCGQSSMDSITVIITNAAPTAGFTYQPIGLNMFAFTDGSTNATSWSWDFGDSQTATTQSPTHTYASAGTYTVTLIVTNGCGADTITQVVAADAIEVHAIQNGISVYPNPAHDQLHVLFMTATSGTVRIELCDLQGRVVSKTETVAQQAVGSVDVDLSGIAAGVYVLKITEGDTLSTERIEVQ